ncbi:MAG: hypothetical protein J2P57_17215 [Acidimicrobiaceae bacterium]|nr:hypothetical protein [Acidimicrobiaceae bacterium]
MALIVLAAWLPSPSLAVSLIGGAAIGPSSAAFFQATLESVVATGPKPRSARPSPATTPPSGVGIALRFFSPRITLLAYTIAVGGLLAASRILLG